ncbi:MAG: hypothetical protein NXI10_13770 [bacterium]|nr:hypothetical protein [bacterium]
MLHPFKVFAFVMLTSTLYASAQEDKFVLTGIWQENLPMIASGWSTNYQFFEDGRVNYNHNQMDCADSVITESGTYKFKNNTIKIKFDSMTLITGGTLQEATGSCGSEYEIVGGEMQTQSYKRKIKFKIQEAEPLDDYDYLDRIIIDDVSWFRMAHNPDDY